MKRKAIHLKPGDKVRLCVGTKCMDLVKDAESMKYRGVWYPFNEWSPYLKQHHLTLVFERYSGSYDYFTVQKTEDARIVYVS